jgi:hypothetical protein
MQEIVMFLIMPPNLMSRDSRIDESHNTRTKAIVAAAIPMAAIIVAAALVSGFLSFFSSYQQPAIAQQQNMTGTNATTTGGGGAQSSSACNPTQTGGGSQNATTSTAGGAAGGNQSTTSEVRMHIEEACMAAQSGDMQGVLMHLNLALNALEGNITTTAEGSGASNATTTLGEVLTEGGNTTADGDGEG